MVPICRVPLEAQSVPSRIPVIVSLSAHRNTSKRGESFGISRIGSKIKGVFKSTTMEGAMLPSSGVVEGEDDLVRVADAQPVENRSTLLCHHTGAQRLTLDERLHTGIKPSSVSQNDAHTKTFFLIA